MLNFSVVFYQCHLPLFYDRIALGTGVQVMQPSAGKDEAAHQFDSGADRVGAGLSQ